VSGEQRHRQVVAAVLATDPTLSAAQVGAAIAAVAGHPAALRSLAVALTADPAALTIAAPPVVGRLIEALRAGGATSLPEPSCAVCARLGQPLTRSSTGGVCARCRRRELAEGCARCGVIKPVAGRDSQRRPVCARCADRPQRQCGRCGRIRRIARRAQGEAPDICDGCFQLPEATCSGCGRRRPCNFASTNTPVCTRCAPRRTLACARCGQDKPPVANWAEGPVCDPCYRAALRHRGECAACGQQRRLVAPAGPDADTCSDCAGLPVTHACTDCGIEDKLYERGRCDRCSLRRRAAALLAGPDGRTDPALMPVLEAICAARAPRSALNWLNRSYGAAILADVASGTLPATHQALDAHPRRRAADFLRQMLTAGGALPARDEDVARTEQWLTSLLDTIEPGASRQLVQAYATWQVMRRLRASAAHPGPRTYTAHARNTIGAAASFLAWLAGRGRTLGACGQNDIETWLATGPAACQARDFLSWAARHGHCRAFTIPRPVRTSGTAVSQDQRWVLAARLLHDDTLDLTDRAAGCLLLLYGQQLSRIAVMTTSQVTSHDGGVLVRFGGHDVPVPGPLGVILTELARSGRSHTGTGTPAVTPWLFPGGLPGRPITASRLCQRLGDLGVQAMAGRRAALLDLAAQLPAAVLADLLSIAPTTAVRWMREAGGDWSRYAADLARSRNHQP
jgi:hypothetical protein